MARHSKSNRAAKIIAYIVLVLILMAAVGAVAYLTKWGTSNIKTFSLTIGDRIILRDEGDITISSGEQIKVNSPDDYTVAVYAYSEDCDFAFLYGEEAMHWSDFGSRELLSSSDCGIDIQRNDYGFVLVYDSIQSIISNSMSVTITNSVSGDIFLLAVTSNDCTLYVTFGIGDISAITDVTLPPELIF